VPLQIAIVGAGRVGMTIAFALLCQGFSGRLLLSGQNQEKIAGEMHDLHHAGAFLPHPPEVIACPVEEINTSDIVILTASSAMTNMTDRLELLEENAKIFRKIIPPLAARNPQAIFVVITNPVDVMTYLTLRWSGFSPQRVMGTGTLIDSGRFRALLGKYSGINPSDVHAYILGEHGESEFPVLSKADMGGMTLKTSLPVCRKECPLTTIPEVFEEAKNGGMMVYRQKGYTNYAIALATTTLLAAIMEDSGKILPVSTLLEGYLGIEDVCLSVPAVIGREGILKTLELEFSQEEREAFHRSATKLKKVIQSILF